VGEEEINRLIRSNAGGGVGGMNVAVGCGDLHDRHGLIGEVGGTIKSKQMSKGINPEKVKVK